MLNSRTTDKQAQSINTMRSDHDQQYSVILSSTVNTELTLFSQQIKKTNFWILGFLGS